MLIVLSGLPGVGKTTIARELARVTGAVHVRVDSIEQALRCAGWKVEGEGYEVAHAVAEDNLRLGRVVVADCVNPWPLTRAAWRAVAERAGVRSFDVEVVCSDPVEHQRRVESRSADIPGHVLPTWSQVAERDYRQWDSERLVIDTSTRAADDCVRAILASLANPLILAVDVAYSEEDAAYAAAVAFRGYAAAEPIWEGGATLLAVQPYEPGAFFKRELPCILAAVAAARGAGIEPDMIVIDGYATFGEGHRTALGEHVARETLLPVIGVAKTSFSGADHLEVVRGSSAQPLFVTAVGMPAATVAAAVSQMHGNDRIPALLARVDRAARAGLHHLRGP